LIKTTPRLTVFPFSNHKTQINFFKSPWNGHKQFGILKHKTNKTDVSFTIEQVNLTPLAKGSKMAGSIS
jgi:hypothetical protein